MKRINCPKCGKPIAFDNKNYNDAHLLAFACPNCGKKIAIRQNNMIKQHEPEAEQTVPKQESVGCLLVIENVFHYKQVIPLVMGNNIIGRFMKDTRINCPIMTDDPSIDITHCVINVSRDKNGNLKYILRDGPSNTGTFVSHEILGDREQRVIEDGTLFTIGATSIILKAEEEK